MFTGFPLFPDQASTLSKDVDALYFFMVGISVFFSVAIFLAIFFFAIKFRRKSDDEWPEEIHGSLALELVWSIIPFLITIVMFVWGASIYFSMSRPPDDSIEVNVVGKRWMWKLQHMNGRREINELHVPVGVPVKLRLASEDVIHSFFVPAFRMKKDAVPGRYNYAWFKATHTGTFHLFCAEYCGTKHSAMIGSIVVMEPDAFQAWLGGETGAPLAVSGEKLFRELNCITCHRADAQARGPLLDGVFGKPVALEGGDSVVADEAYLRESILNPARRVTAGYQPIMPTYQGQVSEEQILQLIAYIKSLRGPGAAAPPPAPPARSSLEPGEKERASPAS